MGRPLSPPTSTMADHGIVQDTVVQIFMRRPTQTALPSENSPQHDQDVPGLAQSLNAVCGFALLCSWMYLLVGVTEEDEEEEMNVPVLICLLILTVIFALSGGITRLF